MRPVFFVFLVVISAVTQAELYRWTDESGRVHFGDQPPVDREAQTLEEKTAPLIGQGEEVHRIHQRVQRLLDAEHQRDSEVQAKAEEEKRSADKEQKRCAKMRKRLVQYTGRIFDKDNNAFLTDEQIEADRQKMQAWLNENCPH